MHHPSPKAAICRASKTSSFNNSLLRWVLPRLLWAGRWRRYARPGHWHPWPRWRRRPRHPRPRRAHRQRRPLDELLWRRWSTGERCRRRTRLHDRWNCIGIGGGRPIGGCPGNAGGGRTTCGYVIDGADMFGIGGREICYCTMLGAGQPTPCTGSASPGLGWDERDGGDPAPGGAAHVACYDVDDATTDLGA